MAQEIYANMRQRIDTAANWSAENPVLGLGEIGVVSDSEPRQFKIGDGVTAWNSLTFAGSPGTAIESIDDIADVNLSANQAPSDGRALIYQNGEWITGPAIGGYSYQSGGDPDFASTKLLARFQGTPGNSNFVDASSISDIVTVAPFGGVAYSGGQVRAGSSSAFFDGINDQITYTASSVQSIGASNYTIEAWFYATAAPSQQKAIVSFEQNGYNCVMTLRPELSIQFYLGVGGGGFAISGSTVNIALLNQWNHAAVVRNGNAYTIYINGVGTSIGSASNNFPDYTIIRIGNESEGLLGSNSFFSGYIDSVRFSTIARYTENFTPAPSAFPGLPTTISLPYSINNLDDVDTETSPPSDTDLLGWSEADGAFIPVPRPAELGAQSLLSTATDLAAGAASDFTLAAGSTSLLLSFEASRPCWIRVYGTAAARTADTRTEPGGIPPDPGSDFYAEAATTAPEQSIRFSPVPTLQGDSGLVYVRAVNMDSVTRTIEMSFSVLTLEA